MSVLLELSTQTDARARHELAVKLLQNRSDEGAQAVLTLLSSKGSDSAKLTVCEAIAEVGGSQGAWIQPLLSLMQSREAAIALRRAAAAALASYQHPPVEILDKLKAFRHEQDAILLAENHAILMKALHDCTPEADRAALVQAWLKQPLALERYTALDIVQQNLRKRVPDPALLGQVRQLLSDPDDSVRQKCVFVLRTLGQREDAPRLQRMLAVEGGQPDAVREAIFSALGLLGDPGCIPTVIAGLQDPEPSVAAEAATALKGLVAQRPGLPDAAAEPAVQALLRRASSDVNDPMLRERVIDAMATIADPAFLSDLVAHAGPDEPIASVRQAAVRGLGRIGNPSALPLVLQQLAEDPDAGVRQAAAAAVADLGRGNPALSALRERLDPRTETSVSVHAKAWEAYLLVFEKLAIEEQQQVVDGWPTDGAGASRRIELLTLIERKATALPLPDAILAQIREQLGDALIAQSRPADAAPVLARGLEVMKAARPTDRTRVALKMIDSYLSTAPEKAIAAAARVQDTSAREAVADRLLAFVEAAWPRDASAAAAVLDRLMQTVPDQFGPAYAARFERVRKRLPPASRPASTPAG